MPKPIVRFEIRPTSTWRVEFRRAEMDFFQIALSEWRVKATKKLKELHPNYSQAHAFHVQWLNQRLPMARPLKTGDFNGDITLIKLRDTVVANRVKVENMARVQLQADDTMLNKCGLGHLLSLSSRTEDND